MAKISVLYQKPLKVAIFSVIAYEFMYTMCMHMYILMEADLLKLSIVLMWVAMHQVNDLFYYILMS